MARKLLGIYNNKYWKGEIFSKKNIGKFFFWVGGLARPAFFQWKNNFLFCSALAGGLRQRHRCLRAHTTQVKWIIMVRGLFKKTVRPASFAGSRARLFMGSTKRTHLLPIEDGISIESTSNLRRTYAEPTSNLRRTYVESTPNLHRTYIEPTSGTIGRGRDSSFRISPKKNSFLQQILGYFVFYM